MSQKFKEMGLSHQGNKMNDKSFKIGKKFAATKYLQKKVRESKWRSGNTSAW